MTAPRQVLPGSTYLVTRRCAQRLFLLKPSATTNQVFLYLLAIAARRFGIEIHAFCVLSNHYHLVITDTQARLPAFHQFLDALVARALNASLGRWEAFWAPNSYSAVRLASPTDVIDKVAYVLSNPVAAGLVAAGSVWPGLWSGIDRIGGEELHVHRPKHFFDPRGAMPKDVNLQLATPRGFETAERFRAVLAAAVADREAKARSVRHARGGFLGVARVLAQKPTAHPKGDAPRRNLSPRFAARDRWKRMEILGSLAEFLSSYREAWASWRRGVAHVIFPAGTYLMRVMHGVPCAAAG